MVSKNKNKFRTFWGNKWINNYTKNDDETDKTKTTNSQRFVPKIQITAKTKRLTLEKKVRKNLEDFEAKIQIIAQITRLKVVNK